MSSPSLRKRSRSGEGSKSPYDLARSLAFENWTDSDWKKLEAAAKKLHPLFKAPNKRANYPTKGWVAPFYAAIPDNLFLDLLALSFIYDSVFTAKSPLQKGDWTLWFEKDVEGRELELWKSKREIFLAHGPKFSVVELWNAVALLYDQKTWHSLVPAERPSSTEEVVEAIARKIANIASRAKGEPQKALPEAPAAPVGLRAKKVAGVTSAASGIIAKFVVLNQRCKDLEKRFDKKASDVAALYKARQNPRRKIRERRAVLGKKLKEARQNLHAHAEEAEEYLDTSIPAFKEEYERSPTASPGSPPVKPGATKRKRTTPAVEASESEEESEAESVAEDEESEGEGSERTESERGSPAPAGSSAPKTATPSPRRTTRNSNPGPRTRSRN
mmetsp:Transcript_62469/g.129769  ORF Transcript_62469/g.129769 Transcript_62469/m.129769 type:complete len:387 (+) Transcript_62469:3710-4870(+)